MDAEPVSTGLFNRFNSKGDRGQARFLTGPERSRVCGAFAARRYAQESSLAMSGVLGGG
jgi:hypothetical protein